MTLGARSAQATMATFVFLTMVARKRLWRHSCPSLANFGDVLSDIAADFIAPLPLDRGDLGEL